MKIIWSPVDWSSCKSTAEWSEEYSREANGFRGLYKLRCLFTDECSGEPIYRKHQWYPDQDTRNGVYDFDDVIHSVKECLFCGKTKTVWA